jgi:hypothetical protein
MTMYASTISRLLLEVTVRLYRAAKILLGQSRLTAGDTNDF